MENNKNIYFRVYMRFTSGHVKTFIMVPSEYAIKNYVVSILSELSINDLNGRLNKKHPLFFYEWNDTYNEWELITEKNFYKKVNDNPFQKYKQELIQSCNVESFEVTALKQ